MSGSAERRPRLLFLAYYFPPQAVTASVRAWNAAKYLSRLGWEVTVVTPDPSLVRRVEEVDAVAARLEQEQIGRILTGVRWRWLDAEHLACWNRGLGWLAGGLCRRAVRRLGFEGQAGWGPGIAEACCHLRAGDVDVVLATGTPFTAFEAAARLADRLRCGLVLDYRDAWTGNPHGWTPFARRSAPTEERLLRKSAAVTVVSPSLAAALRERFPSAPAPRVVFNGFDPEEMARIRPVVFDHFAVVYTGIFYPPKRVIDPVIAALRLVRDRASTGGTVLPDWRFHYYGPQSGDVLRAARQYGLEARVVLHGSVPRAESLAALRGADLSIVVTSVEDHNGVEDRGIVTAKVFDALGLASRVLLVAPRGSDAGPVVEESGCGRRFSGAETPAMADYIAEVMAGSFPRPEPPHAYAWPNLARTLVEILRGAAAAAER